LFVGSDRGNWDELIKNKNIPYKNGGEKCEGVQVIIPEPTNWSNMEAVSLINSCHQTPSIPTPQI
jgi:hypothetical protein